MKDAAVVGGDIVGIEEEAFLHWTMSVARNMQRMGHDASHRLKLVTGVEISTRPVRRFGREGKAKKSTSLRAAAEVKRVVFRRSITMFDGLKGACRFI